MLGTKLICRAVNKMGNPQITFSNFWCNLTASKRLVGAGSYLSLSCTFPSNGNCHHLHQHLFAEFILPVLPFAKALLSTVICWVQTSRVSIFSNTVPAHNQAKQHQSLRFLDSLAVARFVHGFAIIAQTNQQQVCRCLRR